MDILFVCYANLCRSPIAERLTMCAVANLPALGEQRLTVSSAGTHAEPGMAMHPVAHAVLAEAGIDPDGFASQPVSAELLTGARLVLTAERRQRAFCAALAPTVLRRTFTLRQFGRLAGYVRPDRLDGVAPRLRLPALVDEVLSVRAEVLPAGPDEDDLVDPVDGTVEDMQACVCQVRASLRPVLELLGHTAYRPDPAGVDTAPLGAKSASAAGRLAGSVRDRCLPSR